ncbi:MAG TPA: hypothetical protein HPP66_10585 [Planctomycetes bacterium]|nr:hypothetical protein [Planctomycetota bacterium]
MKPKTCFAKRDVVVVLGCVVFLLITLGAIGNGASEEARRLEMRSVCLSNLKSLALAWLMYTDDNQGMIVNGAAGISRPNEPAWVGRDWDHNYMQGKQLSEKKQKAAIKAGLFWPYCRGLEVYRCPAALKGNIRTYSIVDSMNGYPQPDNPRGRGPKQVMNALLIIKQRPLIRRPHKRIIFIDEGWAAPGSYPVYYDKELWLALPPVRHDEGVTVSFADGHSEYWQWKGSETIRLGRIEARTYTGKHIAPETAEGKEDLHKVQKAVWGKLGYTATD